MATVMSGESIEVGEDLVFHPVLVDGLLGDSDLLPAELRDGLVAAVYELPEMFYPEFVEQVSARFPRPEGPVNVTRQLSVDGIRAQLLPRLKEPLDGGKPHDPRWTAELSVPVSRQTARGLDRLSIATSTHKQWAEPAQLAAYLIEQALERMEIEPK